MRREQKGKPDGTENLLDLRMKRISVALGILVAAFAVAEGVFKISDLFFQKKASQIELSGRVENREHHPIEGATISVVSTHFQTKSLVDGTFKETLHGKSKGDLIKLIVSHQNYKTWMRDRTISSDKEFLEISME